MPIFPHQDRVDAPHAGRPRTEIPDALHLQRAREHPDFVAAFAREVGVPILAPSDLVTAEARTEWEAMAAFGESVSTLYNTERRRPPAHSGAV